VTPCAVCTVHIEMRSTSFFGGALKPLRRFLPVWPQNRWRQFSWFGLKTKGDCFLVWTSKSVAVVWWFVPQNHRDGLWLKTKQTSVYRLRHKTDGGRTVRDTRRDLTACFI
jgi:hypothetical protein